VTPNDSHEHGRAPELPRFPDEIALAAATTLARRIGSEKVVDDPDIVDGYGRDESQVDPVAPAVVVRARSAEDVRAALEVAGEEGVPVTPRAGGTGKSGGAIPLRGGWVLALAGLDQVVEIDEENLTAVVQPGVVTGRLHDEVEARGLFFPPDPASLETCCIGGNVAENAGGPRAFKYGVTSHYVLGLEVVVPAGARRMRIGRRTTKGVAGYDVTSLLVGSEGTLGVFTEITLRLVPRPHAVRTLLGLFGDPAAAGRAVSQMVRAGLVPRVIELLDGVSVETLRSAGKLPIPSVAGAVLLVEVDGDERALDGEVERVAGACESQGALDVLAMRTQAEARTLWAGRRELSELLNRAARHKLADDIVVPRSAIATMIQVSAAIGARRDVVVATYGHAGDGNLHVNLLWDDDDASRAEAALEEIVTAAVGLGGTITGEHGVGAAKRHLLALEQSPELIDLQRQLKAVFDPAGILNPGKIFP
jgi:glycolate oxidase